MSTRMRWRLISRNFPLPMGHSGIILCLIIVSTVSLEGCGMQESEEAASLRAAAEQGDAEAQYKLGVAYANGEGVAQNDEEAVQWTRMAAEQGFAQAQHNLGAAYRYGLGVAQDYEEAVQWFLAAAEQGNASAQNNVGVMYADGRGVRQDYEEAYAWIGAAAAQGYSGTTETLQALREEMTPSQVESAVELAREYREKYVTH